MSKPILSKLSDTEIKKLLKEWQLQLESSKNEIKRLQTSLKSSQTLQPLQSLQSPAPLTIISDQLVKDQLVSDLKTSNQSLTDVADKLNQTTDELAQITDKLTEANNTITQLQQTNNELTKNIDIVKKLLLKETAARKGLHEDLINTKGNIRIFVRMRPPTSPTPQIPITYVPDDCCMLINDQHKQVKFNFDAIFAPDASQTYVYDSVKPFLTSVMDGANVTLLAYGQTGSGKTYTMQGTTNDPGVNIRSLNSIFELTKQREESWSYTFSVSILEIYLEQLYDLLSEKKEILDIKMHPETKHNYCPGITTLSVKSPGDVHTLLEIADKNRTVARHNMNEHSSRSHLVFTLECVGVSLHGGKPSRSKLTLVDLAGSERISKTDVHGEQLKEAQSINKSLSALGDVIAALGSGGHVPYRNSKLTYLLQDQFSGSGKLGFFANCHQTSSNLQETMFTLKFAERCRSIELRTGANKKKVFSPQ